MDSNSSAAGSKSPADSNSAAASATGPQATIAPPMDSVSGATGHPTLNTKPLFKLMVEKKASDLFFTSNAPIKIKIEGQILPVNKQILTPETVRQTAFALMSSEQREYIVNVFELDFAISEPGLGRFRVNVFMQRGFPAMVLRYITADMPRIESLGLPPILTDLVSMKRGLILMVGSTGSGKSTSLAALIDYRNETASARVWKRPSTWPARGTWCSPPSTPTTARSPWTASSTCSRGNNTARSSSTCPNTCAPSWRSAWSWVGTANVAPPSR